VAGGEEEEYGFVCICWGLGMRLNGLVDDR
jgi:hypothetical protein